jgi:exosortase/archaeosortase family protein
MTALASRDGDVFARPIRPGMRVAAVVLCSAIAYSFSLETLVGGWRYQTPLADLALVPFLAAVLLVAAYRRHPHVVDLRLARIDIILAAFLVLVALALLVTGPVLWSKYFWATRLDLLTLPLFVAAALMLLFGTRALVRFGFALGFLLLLGPLPYHAIVDRTLGLFTAVTAWTATMLAGPLGLAQPDPATQGLFMVEHDGEQFSVLVGSACSGVNTLVGFLVVGIFGLYFVRGATSRRVLWLLVGAMLVWSFNIVRILGILAVGKEYGEQAAFDVLHPIAGLIALNAAALTLVLLMRPFGLRWRRAVEVDSPLAQPGEPHERATPTRFLRRLALLAGATVVVAVANITLQDTASGFSNDGRPAVAPFTDSPSVGPDWRAEQLETIGWATPYYGEHSSWVRYRVRPADVDGPPFTIWLDAVRSPDLGALNAYTLAHCYDFHDFDVNLARRVDLGDGVIGQAFVYDTPRATWHVVSWQWPVLLGDGRTEHERIVMLASTENRPDAEGGSGGLRSWLLSLLDLRAPNTDSNPALTRALKAAAAAAVRDRLRSTA